MATEVEYVGIGYCSNDHLAVVPFIPMDTKVQMISHAILGGGPAGNSTAGAATLGKKAAFIGTVGDDPDGRTILADFEAQGVDTSFMKVREGATSAIAYLLIEEKTGNRSCVWTREGLTELTADEVDLDLVRNAKVLHLDGHQPAAAIAGAPGDREGGRGPPAKVRRAVRRAGGGVRDERRAHAPLDGLHVPAPWVRPDPGPVRHGRLPDGRPAGEQGGGRPFRGDSAWNVARGRRDVPCRASDSRGRDPAVAPSAFRAD